MSLLFPAYLLGLLGLALPWLLHRFSDQKPPEQLFPSKRFLDATTPPVSRKRTLRHRILLALRVLSVLLLCFLFAQPWLKQSGFVGDPDQHHIIAIDQSLSMRAGDRWELALAEAQRLIDELSANNSVELVGFDNKVRVLGSNLEQSPALPTSLDDLEPSYIAADYGVLMQRINKLASDQDLPVKLWLVSDMQQSALPAQRNALYAPSVADLELVAVQGDPTVNVHLSASADTTDGVNVAVTAKLLASSSVDAAAGELERTVAVEFNDQLLASERVLLQPGKLEIINFENIVLPAQSDPRLHVRLLEPDALVEDNQHVLVVGKNTPASIVHLRATGAADDDSSVFVRTALETDEIAKIETIRGTAEQMPVDTLHVVAGRQLTESVDLDILQFVDTGSNALVFNTRQNDIQTNTSIVGSEIAEVDEAHPLALGDIDWFGVNFYELPALQLQEDDRVLLKTTASQAILVERATERGRLLILNDPLDGRASNLPLQPAFVSLIHAMIKYFDASTAIPSEVVVGHRVPLPPNIQVLDPDENPLLEIEDSTSASTLEFETPGLHTVVGNRGEQSLRVVLDAQEADLSVLSDSTIEAWSARYSESAATGNASTDSDTKAVAPVSLNSAGDQLRESLWRWLFPLLLVAFMLESLFANRRLDVRRDGS